MKTAHLALPLLLALALAGCGGGGESAPGQPTTQPVSAPPDAPACTARVVSVALLGDSTQVGVDGLAGGVALHNPGTELQVMMDARFGIGSVVVTDYGVSSTVAARAPRVTADVIVANYGINDMREPGQTPEQFANELKAAGITLAETQLPIVDRSWPEADYVAAAKSIGAPVADVNAYVLALPDWQSYYPDTPAGAGVHPSDALYQLVVDNVLAPAVAKQVAPLRCQ